MITPAYGEICYIQILRKQVCSNTLQTNPLRRETDETQNTNSQVAAIHVNVSKATRYFSSETIARLERTLSTA